MATWQSLLLFAETPQHNMAEEKAEEMNAATSLTGLVQAHDCFNAETFFLHDRGFILREAGVYLTLKELGNYLAMCQQVRRLMIGDERYVIRFWQALALKNLVL